MKPFFTDANFLQNFVEVELKDKFVSAATFLGFGIMTTPTCMQELPLSVAINIKKDISAGTIEVIDDPSRFTGSGRGERSIVEWIKGKTISNASVGTADQSAIKTFNRQSIRTFDHIEFLWIMVRIGIVSLIQAIRVYAKWSIPKKYHQDNFLLFYANQEKQILSKLGITALLL